MAFTAIHYITSLPTFLELANAFQLFIYAIVTENVPEIIVMDFGREKRYKMNARIDDLNFAKRKNVEHQKEKETF